MIAAPVAGWFVRNGAHRMHIERFEIDKQFHGPPRSGNGGYTCGCIARHLQGTVAVRLKAPPPLKTELRLETHEHEARLFDGATLIGEARQSVLNVSAPRCPSYEDAVEASGSYIGFKMHSFPGCFVCGPERQPHDGLRIFPGPLKESSTIAAPWTPAASLADASGNVKPEFLWAALDCAGAFAHFPLPEGLAIVLGELTASIAGTVRAGKRCIVLGWPRGAEGRKRLSGTAVYGPGERLIALGQAVWIEVPSSSWS
jgi:hypothetical protein